MEEKKSPEAKAQNGEMVVDVCCSSTKKDGYPPAPMSVSVAKENTMAKFTPAPTA